MTGERRRRLLVGNHPRHAMGLSKHRSRWKKNEQLHIFRQAAANGDLFIKETATTVPVAAAPTAGGDDDNVSFL